MTLAEQILAIGNLSELHTDNITTLVAAVNEIYDGAVKSIVKTDTTGLIDTYTITYGDDSTAAFTVTNGATGATGATGAKGDTGPAATIDAVLSETSENAIQNAAVATAIASLVSSLGDKQGALTFDSVPTSGSTNPVQSGGVASALDGKIDTSDAAKQLADFRTNQTYTSETIEPIITFIDDDISSAVYSRLKPIFESKGVPCCLATIPNYIGDYGFLSLDNLKEFYASGWEMLGHNENPLDTYTTDSDLDFQVGENCKGMLELGGIKMRGYVYPQNVTDERIRRTVRKYYDFGFGNTSLAVVHTDKLLDTMRISRFAFGSYTTSNPTINGNSEKNTLAYYKACVDYAVANSGWLVFMSHVGGQTAEQDLILSDLIDYIKSLNVKIATATDGYKVHGNKLFMGDVGSGECVAVDKYGNLYCENYVYPGAKTCIYAVDFVNSDSVISDYADGTITYATYTNAYAASKGNFPITAGGTLVTHKVEHGSSSPYNRQEYWPYNTKRKFVRYATSLSAWSTWDEYALLSTNVVNTVYQPMNTYTAAQLITAYTAKKITITSNNAAGGTGFPDNAAGMTTTYRFSGNGWDYQIFKKYNSFDTYIRYVDTAGAWSAFKQISIP